MDDSAGSALAGLKGSSDDMLSALSKNLNAYVLGDKVVVNTDVLNCPSFDVDDYLRISFDGKMALSYPPQVLCVYSIKKIYK